MFSFRLEMQTFSCGNAIYSTKFNPLDESLIGCVFNENFGIRGAGFFSVIRRHESGLLAVCSGKCSDALFDVAWLDINLLATSGGDGSVGFWMAASGGDNSGPVKSLPVHTAEAHALDAWEGRLVSCGWDAKIGLIDIASCTLLRSFSGEC